MLKLIVSADVPMPVKARTHVANQEQPAKISSQAGLSALRRGAELARALYRPIVGIGSPAGDSGATDPGSAGAARVASDTWGGEAA